MNLLVGALLSPEVEVGEILEESTPVSYRLGDRCWTYSGKLKNSGINSLTSPLISLEADSYAFFTSLRFVGQMIDGTGKKVIRT